MEELQDRSSDVKKLVDEVSKTIEMGIYNKNWDKQIMMLEKVIRESSNERGI